jgi:hypothetical protein
MACKAESPGRLWPGGGGVDLESCLRVAEHGPAYFGRDTGLEKRRQWYLIRRAVT